MTDSRETEQLIATYFHASRKEEKAARKKSAPTAGMHHRAATDWWNFVGRK